MATTNTVYSDGYIGAETLLLKRDIYKGIFDRYRENEGLTDFLLNFGYKQKTANTTYNWWEHDYLIQSVTVEAAPAFTTTVGRTGASNDIAVVTIQSTSHQETGTRSPFIVGQLVMIGGVRGRISAVDKSVDDAHVYTIVTVSATDTWTGATSFRLVLFQL